MEKDNLISESDLVTVYDIPYSILYCAKVIKPDGKTTLIESMRAYTRSIRVYPDGKVDIVIGAKDKKVKPRTIRYPYHFCVIESFVRLSLVD